MTDLQQFINTLVGILDDHWMKIITGAVLMAAGWFLGLRRARSEWAKKEFLHRINVSLNVLRDGKLLIRTIIEKSCKDVFLNTVAADAVIAAARSTTEKDPILNLPSGDYWYYLNAVLNEVAEKFAEGQIRRDLGLPVTSEAYLICLTSERAGAVRTRKVRAMVLQKKLLDNLPEKQPAFESPNHSTRWDTLNLLAKEWKQNPYKFLELEICL